MKSKDVLKLLKITRVTLWKYVRDNKIKVTKLDNGYYDYDRNSVLKLMRHDNRMNIIYARVSTYKQKNDLDNQIEQIKNFCEENKYPIDFIYSEISSGLDLDRNKFDEIINLVIDNKVSRIFISYKDRLTRNGFTIFERIFFKFGCEIIVINKEDKTKEDELYEDMISIMHHFTTKKYSERKKNSSDKNKGKIKKENKKVNKKVVVKKK